MAECAMCGKQTKTLAPTKQFASGVCIACFMELQNQAQAVADKEHGEQERLRAAREKLLIETVKEDRIRFLQCIEDEKNSRPKNIHLTLRWGGPVVEDDERWYIDTGLPYRLNYAADYDGTECVCAETPMGYYTISRMESGKSYAVREWVFNQDEYQDKDLGTDLSYAQAKDLALNRLYEQLGCVIGDDNHD